MEYFQEDHLLQGKPDCLEQLMQLCPKKALKQLQYETIS